MSKSLRITGSTRLMVSAFSAAVALNGMVAIRALGPVGQGVLFAVIFVSLSAGAAAVSVDIFNRSSQAVSNLRSIGASRWSISSAVVNSVLVYGAVASTVGAALGAALGSVLAGSGLGVLALFEVLAVAVASAAALAAGVYAGGRVTWRS